jgi:hypothetical protein
VQILKINSLKHQHTKSTLKMANATEQQVLTFVEDFTGKNKNDVALFDNLVSDWKIDGDEALQFARFFAEKFHVDMKNFHFDKHFKDETAFLTENAVLSIPLFFISAALAFWQSNAALQAQMFGDTQLYFNATAFQPLSYLWSQIVLLMNFNPTDFQIWFVYLLLNLPFAYICTTFIRKIFSVKEKKTNIYLADLFRMARHQKWDL